MTWLTDPYTAPDPVDAGGLTHEIQTQGAAALANCEGVVIEGTSLFVVFPDGVSNPLPGPAQTGLDAAIAAHTGEPAPVAADDPRTTKIVRRCLTALINRAGFNQPLIDILTTERDRL